MFDIQPWDWIICISVAVAAAAMIISAIVSFFATDVRKRDDTRGTGVSSEIRPSEASSV